MKAVTQLDIAKALGISQTTVGLVVGSSRNGKKLAKIPASTIQRIRAKAEEMGYRPHRHAQAMRTGKSMHVGIIYSQNHLQVASERTAGIVSELQRHHYDPIFFDISWQSADVRAAVNYLTSANVAGILLLVGYTKPEEIKFLTSITTPMVGLSVYQLGGVPEVRCDMRRGYGEIFRHLVARGCHRIALAAAEEPIGQGQNAWSWQMESQVQGVREAAEENCWSFEMTSLHDYAEWVNRPNSSPGAAVVVCSTREVTSLRRPFDPYSGPRLFAQRLLDSSRQLPDAFIFPNDEWAYAFACEATRRGIRIPEDLAITGFNDSSLGRAFTIPLTSVRQPTEAMARTAVELLIREINGDHSQRTVHQIPGELITRESTLHYPGKL